MFDRGCLSLGLSDAGPSEQLKQLGFSAAAIGLGEEYEEGEKAAREEKFELVFGY